MTFHLGTSPPGTRSNRSPSSPVLRRTTCSGSSTRSSGRLSRANVRSPRPSIWAVTVYPLVPVISPYGAPGALDQRTSAPRQILSSRVGPADGLEEDFIENMAYRFLVRV